MLDEIFYWVFNMSVMGVVSGSIIMLLRLIKIIPRRVFVFLWIIPFFRMVCPLGLNNPYSLMSLLSKVTTRTVVAYRPMNNIAFSMTNYTMAADEYFPVTYKENTLEKVFMIASFVWIIVFLAIFAMLLVVYFSTLREMNRTSYMHDNIFFSEKAKSPAVYGIIKPKIILPLFCEGKNTELIVLHEKTHIKRRDNLWRLIAVFIATVHWYNPFAWVFLKLFISDLEMSCDECVLKKIGKDRVKEYATLLLESKKKKVIFASPFGGTKMRNRIENILSFKKLTWFSLLCFIMLISVSVVLLLTNAG